MVSRIITLLWRGEARRYNRCFDRRAAENAVQPRARRCWAYKDDSQVVSYSSSTAAPTINFNVILATIVCMLLSQSSGKPHFCPFTIARPKLAPLLLSESVTFSHLVLLQILV